MKPRYPLSILAFALLQAACGGGGDGTSGTATPTGASIIGTVPGTKIEALGDNGSYYMAHSNDNGTAQHPFELDVPPGVGFHLVMTTGEGTPDEVVTPIGYRDSSGNVQTRLALGEGDVVDLGHVPLPMGKNAAAMDDQDNDGVLDSPMVLDDVGAKNPLSQTDVDKDGTDDWNDPDHGGYQYDDQTEDPQDKDGDGIPNSYDSDYVAHDGDSDHDGLPDSVDANPENDPNHDNDALSDDCDKDGYNDEDMNHDGYYDDDMNRDGYHDDDLDHDGHHDNEVDDDSKSCGGSSTPTPTPTPTPTTPTTPTGSPTAGQAKYDAACASCHSAGSLAGKGDLLVNNLGAINPLMNGITLTDQEIADLQAFLNPQ